MNTPKALTVSLVIPVYNEENYLKACLDAVAAQTVLPDEVLVVDNNSTDDSMTIARTYSFVRIVHEKKQGIVFARNSGFDAAKGAAIARIDADTLLPTSWIERVKRYYKDGAHSHYALTGGGYFYNIRLPRFNGWVQSQLAYRMNRLITGYYILWGSNMALPRGLWADVRKAVCQRTEIHEDMDLAIHLHRAGYKITYKAKELRVGVHLKRVFHNRNQLHRHMDRWPKTLKEHGYRLWWLGTVGNLVLWYVFGPMVFIGDALARLFGRPNIR